MKFAIISNHPVWRDWDDGAFGYRYRILLNSLIDEGHDLSYVHLRTNNQDPLDEKVHSIDVSGSESQQKLKKVLGLLIPGRLRPHDLKIRSTLTEINPDVIITILPYMPHLAKNLPTQYPSIFFAEEDFSRGWDTVAIRPNFLTLLRISLRRKIIQRSWPDPTTVVVISDAERKWASYAFKKSRITTLSLFIDDEYWCETGLPSADPIDIFALGDFNYARNAYGLLDFIKELQNIAPSQQIKVTLASKNGIHKILNGLPKDQLDFRGFVEDPRPLYKAARICLVPSFSVSGAKNQILQSWATSCAVVAASPSAKSVGGLNKFDLLSALDSKTLAVYALEALNLPQLRDLLIANGTISYRERNSQPKVVSAFLSEISHLNPH